MEEAVLEATLQPVGLLDSLNQLLGFSLLLDLLPLSCVEPVEGVEHLERFCLVELLLQLFHADLAELPVDALLR